MVFVSSDKIKSWGVQRGVEIAKSDACPNRVILALVIFRVVEINAEGIWSNKFLADQILAESLPGVVSEARIQTKQTMIHHASDSRYLLGTCYNVVD